MNAGYIKLFRRLRQSAFYKDSEYVHLWVHLLMSVNRTPKHLKVGKTNQFIDLLPGQVLTSRKVLMEQTGINRSKIERILKAFENEQQIEQQTFTKYRVISISKWEDYQVGEQQIEQQMSNKRATDEHKQEVKEVKKEDTTADRTRTEIVLLECFCEKEEKLKGLFPQHPFEVVKEGMLAYWRNKPPPLDPYPEVFKWFQREQTGKVNFGKPATKRGLSDDFEKTFLGTD